MLFLYWYKKKIDSPVIDAVKNGRVLIVDEADKVQIKKEKNLKILNFFFFLINYVSK